MTHELKSSTAPEALELIAYADGRLSAVSARGREIAQWLQTHPAAQRRVDDYRRQDRDIRAAFDGWLSAPVPMHLKPAVLRQQRRRGIPQWAMAASIALAAAVVLNLAVRDAPPQDEALVRFAQAAAEQADQQATAPASILAATPDFMPQDFTLSGERQITSAEGPLTLQVFRHADGRELQLFIGEQDETLAQTPHWLRTGEQSLVYWKQGSRMYALSGAISETELGEVAARAMQSPADDLQLAADVPTVIAPSVDSDATQTTIILPPSAASDLQVQPADDPAVQLISAPSPIL